MNTETKIETRNASMRHTATLDVMLAYERDRATAGYNFASGVNSLLSCANMDAAAMRRELDRLLDERQEEIKLAKETRDRRCALVDSAAFADEL